MIACFLLVLSACGTDRESARTMTEQQAAQRAQEHINNAVAALPTEPKLTLQYDDSAECLDPRKLTPGRTELRYFDHTHCPPTQVERTATPLISVGSIAVRSLSSATKSANCPAAILPFVPASPVACADPCV